jgi:uncharacterized protein YbdZ (MbtH family)
MVSLGCCVGCGPDDEIKRYTVVVPQGPQGVLQQGDRPAVTPLSEGTPSRMLGAIVPRGSQTWFFKMTGPAEAVTAQRELFNGLIESLRFTSQTAPPTWDLPEGWKQHGASGMRLATIEINHEGQTLELTVIPLQTRGDPDDYQLANVNRWRGEMGLAPLATLESPAGSDEETGLRQFQLEDTTPVTIVDLAGQGTADHISMRGFDMADHPPIDDLPAGLAGDAGSEEELITFSVPEGWNKLAASGMRRAAFEVVQDQQRLEITVIALARAGGERLPNINRWRGQIGLDDTTEEKLQESLQSVPVLGTTGEYVELWGSGDSDSRQAILAVLVDVANETWFFKLMGPATLAERERQRFREFTASVKLNEQSAGGAGDE